MHAPSSLLLQWHITERCNGRCLHCYQGETPAQQRELGFDALTGVLTQFLGLVSACDRTNGEGRTRAHVTVTGGEPFVREDALDLLELLASYRKHLSFALLTNGTLIDERLARFLCHLRPRFVQVSLDGGVDTHDRIRGAGNHASVCAGVRQLVRRGVPTLVSFTAHRDNYREFPQVVKTAKALGVSRVWADRYIPLGPDTSASGLRTLSPDETRDFMLLLAAGWSKGFPWPARRTEVACHRALQFLTGGGRPYACAAGSTLLTVMSNGDLVPCRRMPVVVGNLLSDSLVDLYRDDAFLRELRRRDLPIAGCEACIHRRLCRGGLRCLARAVTGNPFRADPGCWLATRQM